MEIHPTAPGSRRSTCIHCRTKRCARSLLDVADRATRVARMPLGDVLGASPCRNNECPSVIIVHRSRCARSSSSSSSSVSVSIKTTTSVRTSTSYSAICVAARAARRGRDGNGVLGTTIICSGNSKNRTTASARPPTGAPSAAQCRRTRSCGRGSARVSGRTPPGPSSDRSKSSGC